jgi:hypothetical protein
MVAGGKTPSRDRPEHAVERSWLETIQSLGLDVQLGIILLMLVVDAVGSWLRGSARRSRSPRRRAVAADFSAAAESWPPAPWRASGSRPG